MNDKLNDLVQKIRASATVAGEFAAKTAETAGKKAGEIYSTSKLNLKIFDLNTDVDVLYKDIGRIIYASHTNKDTSTEELEAKLAALDEKMARIDEFKAELSNIKSIKICPNCGETFDKDSHFCPSCGAKLSEEV